MGTTITGPANYQHHIRDWRNAELKKLDWYILRKASHDIDIPTNILNYIEALRDLPANMTATVDDAGNLTNSNEFPVLAASTPE